MELLLQRGKSNDECTIGELFVEGQHQCWTLEDVVRERPGIPVSEWKIPKQTAIPSGTYQVKLTYSPKYQRVMPLIDGVEGFTGIRIHSGNVDKDTEGCILVGRQKQEKSISESRLAFQALFQKLEQAVRSGEKIHISIKNAA
jgi:hypothetical protein